MSLDGGYWKIGSIVLQFGTNGLYYGPIAVRDIMCESDSHNCSISMYLDVA